MTVVVVGSSGPDSGSEMALSDVAVTLVATTSDGGIETVVGDPMAGRTGADGAVELSGVARPADGSHDVRLAVDGTRRTETIDADGCLRTEVWTGSVTGVEAPPTEPLVVRAERVVATACSSDPVVQGRLLDRSGDPLVVADAAVEVVAPAAPAVTIPLAVGLDGAFTAELPAVGTWTEPATVTVRATSAATRSEPFGQGCVRTMADAVTWSQPAALAEGAVLPILELVATEQIVAERCGAFATGSPPPPTSASPGGGVATLPPAVAPRPSPSPDPSSTSRSVVPGGTQRSPIASDGAVAGRTGLPAPDPTPDPPATDAGTTAMPIATPAMVALLLALVAMAVTLAIVIRITRRDAGSRPDVTRRQRPRGS